MVISSSFETRFSILIVFGFWEILGIRFFSKLETLFDFLKYIGLFNVFCFECIV